MKDSARLASYHYADPARWPSRVPGAIESHNTLEGQLENLRGQRARLDVELGKLEEMEASFTEARRITQLRIEEIERVIVARSKES